MLFLIVLLSGSRTGYAQVSEAELVDLKAAVEDSILSLRIDLYTVTAQRDSLSNKLYISEAVHKATKPSVFDNFIVGFTVGIALTIATGIVLNGTWD
ncbi:MAG: hypothetical protein ACTSXE_02835 [Candidatus Thorarchaeota archaeon]